MSITQRFIKRLMYNYPEVLRKRLVGFILLSSLSLALQAANTPVFVGNDLSGKPCNGNYQGYGPFDYTERGRYLKELKKVEDYHFTQDVESLVRGSTTTLPYGDLAYTLRAWPNHHRALNAMSRYQLRLKRRNKSIPIATECWLQRAIHYSPNDATIYMLYGIHLQNYKKLKQAEKNYQIALKLDADNIQTHYNYGLLLFELKKFDEAKNHAAFAYSRSFPLPGLREKLKSQGYWP